MRRWDETHTARARIEIIPMIDVMMFLLVFFVLISINVIPALGIKTNLPQSSQAQDVKEVKSAVITLGREGEVQLDGQPVETASLAQRLHAMEKPGVTLGIVVNGDEAAHMQKLVDVLDVLKDGGFETISIAAKQKPRG